MVKINKGDWKVDRLEIKNMYGITLEDDALGTSDPFAYAEIQIRPGALEQLVPDLRYHFTVQASAFLKALGKAYPFLLK